MSTQRGSAKQAISISAAPEPYVDVKRAASYLAVAVKTLNEWARLEKIPAYPWGDGLRKTWRFKLSELDAWMQGRINSVRRPPLSERSVGREEEAH
jgi:excisionase family DNA binding protein